MGDFLRSLITPAVVVGGFLVFVAVVQMTDGGGRRSVSFHGHGDPRGRAMRHERRHVRVLRGLGVRAGRVKVWEERNGWAGVTEINTSPDNMRRWDALSPAEQAAVYMAGALGREGAYGCADDLAQVDALSSRREARRIARRFV